MDTPQRRILGEKDSKGVSSSLEEEMEAVEVLKGPRGGLAGTILQGEDLFNVVWRQSKVRHGRALGKSGLD